ncbi:MAG: amino-acid N-acetyltransferase [Gammaproteobacteria bacterium]|nr:MAG: amino-acid N-acetyltransferase [Gammaproteobacteria bacterium]
MNTNNTHQFVKWFRDSSPYINAHRGKTFVMGVAGSAIGSDEFISFIHDIALLTSIGIRVVLVYGIRQQIDERMAKHGVQSQYKNGLRITDETAMQYVKDVASHARVDIEALLSMGVANSPMEGQRIRVVGGNFVIARPYGIHDGIDFCNTGVVRRVDVEALQAHLQYNDVVLLSPLGYSPTGEIFNMSYSEIAKQVAIELKADKLIFLHDDLQLYGDGTEKIKELTTRDAEEFCAKATAPEQIIDCLRKAIAACKAGVSRAHLLDLRIDGALLQELFTIDGVGTLITEGGYEVIRQAHIDDVPGILELIQPLEEQGVLVKRSREHLELEIESFFLVERDGVAIGCGGLYPYGDYAEVVCLAIARDYSDQGKASKLLAWIEKVAQQQGVKKLFVLTTHTAHWFQERGFATVDIEQLPMEKQKLYNFKRNSKAFIKDI